MHSPPLPPSRRPRLSRRVPRRRRRARHPPHQPHRPRRLRRDAARFHAPQESRRRRHRSCCRQGGGFLLAEFGAETDGEAEAQARDAALQRLAAPRLAHRPRLHSRRSRAHLAHPRVCPRRDGFRSRRTARLGRLGRCRCFSRAARLLPAPALGADEGVRLPQPDVRPLRPGMRAHCASTSTSKANPGSANSAPSSIRPPTSSSRTAARISGEHGDGQARGALLPKMFGPELMQAFREFKALWDPDNRMNPGKMIDPTGAAVYQPEEDLRLGAGYQSKQPGDLLPVPRRPRLLRRSDRCAALASAPAARDGTARCAPATWRRARSSTPRAAARTCSGS